jgi:hypothetical protein
MFPRLTQEIVMSPLRQQMEADMVVRGLALRTRETYVEWVARFAKYHGKRPDRLGEEEVERYLLHLLEERKLAHSSVNIACSALQFLYRVTRAHRTRSAVDATTAAAGIDRGVLAARRPDRPPPVSVLSCRSHGRHRAASDTACACASLPRFAVSMPNLRDHRPARASPAVQQHPSSQSSSLTRNAPSGIVISHVDQPICPRVDAQAPSPATERRTPPPS